MGSAGGTYDPQTVEPSIYELWEREHCFDADVDAQKRPYSIVIPPPNVTGALHLGHALNNTLQDILIRRARMQGFAACWLPGTDHAGIATQAVVERRLKEEENLTRHELGREGLVEKIWAWKEDYNARILNQLRKMGCSCDWRRTRFTLDDVCAGAVYETFFRLFKDGLIYRGLRLVNWDAALQTAVADDEIVHESVKGSLWHIRYPIEGRDATKSDAQMGVDYLVVATTRPETMLGDTAVAVHPDDERYQKLIGKNVVLPLMDRPIPIIADGLLVRREFGSGAVKVTPGHDPNDYACGQRHDLPMINILTTDGKINESGGAYVGQDRYAARKQVVHDLEQLGLLEKTEPHEHEVGHSDRSKTPIEPLLSEQWFVKMDRLADAAMEAVRDGRVRFYPERYAKSYLDWLNEKRDWCISRQLWWGHRIPVWSKRVSADDAPPDEASSAFHQASAPQADGSVRVSRCLRDPSSELASTLEADGWEQDADVLDTWFSSALWPHSTFGWPGDANGGEPSAELAYFYPTNVLCTARDIISLWVARMVMTGLYNTGADGLDQPGRVPFPQVYIHPVIQDGNGKRMSKSTGNGLDPLDLIGRYGADAMRFTLAQMAGDTQDMRIPIVYLCPHCEQQVTQRPEHYRKATIKCTACSKTFATSLASQTEIDEHQLGVATSERFELGRNFCNKLWQAATGFVIGNLAAAGSEGTEGRRDTDATGFAALGIDDLELEDRWILSRLRATVAEFDERLGHYQFAAAMDALYAFFWSDYCDWYIELVKPRLFSRDAGGELVTHADASSEVARRVLATVLDQTLRLLHPAAPFITEAIWKQLNAAAPQRGVGAALPASELLIRAAWPTVEALPRDDVAEREIDTLREVIRALRETRNRVNGIRAAARETAVKSLPRGVIRAPQATAALLASREPMILRLGQVDAIEIGVDVAKPAESASHVFGGVEVYVPLTGLANLDLERQRLRKERDETATHIGRVEGKLSNEGFVAKAPAAVVEAERERLAGLRAKLATVDRNLLEISE